jgi:small subunit ribosomal protein S16
LQVGAQPSDTAKAILSYKGVLHKDFLLNGVKKGAFTAEQAEAKFEAWLAEKENKITSKVDSLTQARMAKAKADLEREAKMKEAMAAKVLAKNSPLAEEVAESTETEEVVAETEEVAAETEAQVESTETVETPEAEAPAAEEPATEAPAAEEETTPEA